MQQYKILEIYAALDVARHDYSFDSNLIFQQQFHPAYLTHREGILPLGAFAAGTGEISRILNTHAQRRYSAVVHHRRPL